MGVTLASWLAALQALLPPGRALPREAGAVFTRLLEAIAAMFLAAQLRLEGLLAEFDPLKANALLPDWERFLGLPDACTPNEGLSVVARQRLANQRLTEQGGQSRAYFLELADRLGEPNAWIDEFRQTNCNGHCNAALYSLGDAFTWRLNFRRAAEGNRPGNCNDTCQDAVYLTESSLAECPINERKPAHTTVLFAYAVTSYGPNALQAFHTRASKAWAFNEAGVLTEYANNVLRVVPSPVGELAALREPSSTNKCTNFNANPVNIGGVGFTNATNGLATLTVEDDAAALAAAGLHLVCTTGMVYRLDNSLGDSLVTAFPQGVATVGAAHTVSCFMRGNGGAELRLNGAVGRTPLTPGYVRRELPNQMPINETRSLSISADPGAVVYFILNQLEELPFATTPIPVAGAAATRARDVINVPTSVAAGQAHSQLMDFVIPHARNALINNRLTGDNAMAAGITTAGLLQLWNGAQALNTANAYTSNTRGKAAWAGDVSGRSQCLNGGAVASDLNPFGAITRTLMGQITEGTDGNQSPVLYIHEFRTYRWRMSGAELQAATA